MVRQIFHLELVQLLVTYDGMGILSIMAYKFPHVSIVVSIVFVSFSIISTSVYTLAAEYENRERPIEMLVHYDMLKMAPTINMQCYCKATLMVVLW